MSKIPPAIPKHVAIIPDGNRRWAKKRGLKPWEGHFEGGVGKNPEDVAQAALDEGVEYLTLWLGSYDNLTKRSSTEIKMLNKVYRAFIQKMLDDERTVRDGIRVRFIGEWRDLLESETVSLIEGIQNRTKDHREHNLTALVGYSGDREMLTAINSIQKEQIKSVSDSDLYKHLWTKDLPPVDLIIRTGSQGDPHNSAGFMMWHTRYSQLYFTETLWPDFGRKEFFSALQDYSKRERRLGK